MAYTFVSAVGIRRTPSAGWQSINPMDTLLTTLLSDYARILVRLSNTLLADPIVFDLTANRQLFTNPDVTFGTWLVLRGNTVLPTLGKAYSISTAQTAWGDASRSNYTFRQVHPVSHPDMEVYDTERTDLLMTKPTIDYNYMANNSLVCVNGLFHHTEGSEYGLYVRNGRTTKNISDDNLVGILSFSKIAPLQQIPITDSMIFKHSNDQRLYDSTFIDVGQSMLNKTALISIGGYLHVLDQNYREVGDTVLEINWSRIPLAERIFESKDLIDLSALEAYFYNGYSNAITVGGLQSDGLIRAYLTLSQSFIVLVDTPILNARRTYLGRSSTPGVYETYTKPNGLMTSRYGSVLHYWSDNQRGRWVLRTQPKYDFVYTFQTTDWLETEVITDTPDVNRRSFASKAIVTDVLKETVTFTQ
jgi:hypothetical protein